MLEKARTRMCDDGIAADDRYTVQQDRTSLLMLTTIAARAALSAWTVDQSPVDRLRAMRAL